MDNSILSALRRRTPDIEERRNFSQRIDEHVAVQCARIPPLVVAIRYADDRNARSARGLHIVDRIPDHQRLGWRYMQRFAGKQQWLRIGLAARAGVAADHNIDPAG